MIIVMLDGQSTIRHECGESLALAGDTLAVYDGNKNIVGLHKEWEYALLKPEDSDHTNGKGRTSRIPEQVEAKAQG